MSTSNMAEDIKECGWANASFALSESDRAEYARLANTVIDAALEDESVRAALELNLNAGAQSGPIRNTSFGVGSARNSDDEKVYLHAGYQSRDYADLMLPERSQPAAMRQFWPVHEAVLSEVAFSGRTAFDMLGAEAVTREVFTTNTENRNIHVRTVRYIGAISAPDGKEVVSGHADLGVATMHLFETHGGWLKGAPYPPEMMFDVDSLERRAGVRKMRDGMMPIDQDPDAYVNFFLGGSWRQVSGISDELRALPALYHAGFRAAPSDEIISPFASAVAAPEDRVSVVSFMDGNVISLQHGLFTSPTVSNCRPEY